MKTGMVFLQDLYGAVKENSTQYDSPERARIAGYRKQAESAVAEVPEAPGVYLWGTYDRRGYWRSIYLGLAGLSGKSYCLHSRILEELMDEHSCFWRVCRTKQHILNARENGRSARQRAMLKEGATHIIWVTTPRLDRQEVRDVESELIEALNPTANLSRPAPRAYIRKQATLIYNAIREVIHRYRATASPVALKD